MSSDIFGCGRLSDCSFDDATDKAGFFSESINLQCSAEDINRLSALSSLQYLHLEFMHFGIWSDAVQKLASALKHLLNSSHMQYFQVVNCDFDESDSDQQAPLQGVPEGSSSGASDVDSDGHDSLTDDG